MKISQLLPSLAAMVCCANFAAADTFTIGGFLFDQNNSVTTAAIVEGSQNLRDYSNRWFGAVSKSYIGSISASYNEFAAFDRGKSIGRLMGRATSKGRDVARHITFPEPTTESPVPNQDRVVLQLTWGGSGLRNQPGSDFVIYESAIIEGFAVAVQKAGTSEFSAYRYHFVSGEDELHNANATAFDLSDFGIKEGEMITAIRIINVFNSAAPSGPDKVDDASGQGKLLRADDPGYEQGHPLLDKPDGKEFSIDRLNADIVYVVGLHKIEAVSSR